MNKNSFWMMVSGAVGFSIFLIINFTNIFRNYDTMAALLQVSANAFVFISWGKGFLQSNGFKKFVAFCGTVVPVIMASITTWRVLIPFLTKTIY